MTTIFKQDRPVQTIVGAGLYVIPEGRFAKVTLIEGGSPLHINGVEVMPSGGSETVAGFSKSLTVVDDTTIDLYETVYTVAEDGFLAGNFNFDSYAIVANSVTRSCDASNSYGYISLYIAGVLINRSNCFEQGSIPFYEQVETGDIVKVRSEVKDAYSNSVYYNRSLYSYDSNDMILSTAVSKPTMSTTYLKAGDTIEGGKYILSLYEV